METLAFAFLTLSTCSRFSSLPWSWFLSHTAKSLSCVTAPRVSLSWAYSDFTCANTTSKERRLSLGVQLYYSLEVFSSQLCFEGPRPDPGLELGQVEILQNQIRSPFTLLGPRLVSQYVMNQNGSEWTPNLVLSSADDVVCYHHCQTKQGKSEKHGREKSYMKISGKG